MIRELKFRMMCQRHSDDVYRFSRSILGNAEDAEDATQEILLKLWRNLSDVSTMQARGWIMKTTRNHCLNMLRRRSRAAGVLSGGDCDMDGITDESSRGAEAVFYGTEIRSRIDRALNLLPEKLKSVFILYEVNGLKYREIAGCLDIPVNSVKVYLSRSRARLKEILEVEP